MTPVGNSHQKCEVENKALTPVNSHHTAQYVLLPLHTVAKNIYAIYFPMATSSVFLKI